MRVLMIDARQGLVEARVAALQSAGIDADHFSLLAEGDEALQHIPYEMVLVNRDLPDGRGVDWVRSCRRGGLGTPLVIMAPANDIETRINALDAGADDAVADTIDFERIGREVPGIAAPPAVFAAGDYPNRKPSNGSGVPASSCRGAGCRATQARTQYSGETDDIVQSNGDPHLSGNYNIRLGR